MRVAPMAWAGLAVLGLSSAAASPHLLFGEPRPAPPASASALSAPAHGPALHAIKSSVPGPAAAFGRGGARQADTPSGLHATLSSIQSSTPAPAAVHSGLASAALALKTLDMYSRQAPSLQGLQAPDQQDSATSPDAAVRPGLAKAVTVHAIEATLAAPHPATQAPQIVTYDARTPCWEAAAARHGVDPWLLYATAYVESRYSPGAVSGNTNGTVDMGLMQVNSTWLPTLRKYGITRATLMNACASTYIGAWIMAQNFRRYGYSWKAIAAYNVGSLDTPRRERIGYDYARKVYAAYDMLSTDPAAVRRLMAGHQASPRRRVYAERTAAPAHASGRLARTTTNPAQAGRPSPARGSVPVGVTPNADEVASALHP